MSDLIDTPTITRDAAPELYLRVNIAQDTKGYTVDTTASVRGACTVEESERLVRELLSAGDTVGRDEVAGRKRLDGAQ